MAPNVACFRALLPVSETSPDKGFDFLKARRQINNQPPGASCLSETPVGTSPAQVGESDEIPGTRIGWQMP
jgi:hypothetical protein